MNDPSATEWDHIVVGTGMGGATCGHALAKVGKRVRFLEKGEDYRNNPAALKGNFLETFALRPDRNGMSEYRDCGRSQVEKWDIVNQRALRVAEHLVKR